MPDPDPPPSGDEEKIIINGGVAARVLDILCDRLYDRFEHGGLSPEATREIVKRLNSIEDDVFKLERYFLDAVGFKGPYSHAIDVQP